MFSQISLTEQLCGQFVPLNILSGVKAGKVVVGVCSRKHNYKVLFCPQIMFLEKYQVNGFHGQIQIKRVHYYSSTKDHRNIFHNSKIGKSVVISNNSIENVVVGVPFFVAIRKNEK